MRFGLRPGGRVASCRGLADRGGGGWCSAHQKTSASASRGPTTNARDVSKAVCDDVGTIDHKQVGGQQGINHWTTGSGMRTAAEAVSSFQQQQQRKQSPQRMAQTGSANICIATGQRAPEEGIEPRR